MLFVCHPKFCISLVFSFSWGHFNSQGKLKTMLMQNFGVTKKSIMVCYGISGVVNTCLPAFLDSKPRLYWPLSLNKISWLFPESDVVLIGRGVWLSKQHYHPRCPSFSRYGRWNRKLRRGNAVLICCNGILTEIKGRSKSQLLKNSFNRSVYLAEPRFMPTSKLGLPAW